MFVVEGRGSPDQALCRGCLGTAAAVSVTVVRPAQRYPARTKDSGPPVSRFRSSGECSSHPAGGCRASKRSEPPNHSRQPSACAVSVAAWPPVKFTRGVEHGDDVLGAIERRQGRLERTPGPRRDSIGHQPDPGARIRAHRDASASIDMYVNREREPATTGKPWKARLGVRQRFRPYKQEVTGSSPVPPTTPNGLQVSIFSRRRRR